MYAIGIPMKRINQLKPKNVDQLPLNGVIDIFYELNSVAFLNGRIG